MLQLFHPSPALFKLTHRTLPATSPRSRLRRTPCCSANRKDDDSSSAAGSARDADTASATPAGLITLISAGPGDAGHLTLAAEAALREADVVMHDLHVPPSLLSRVVSPNARIVPVGKARGLRTGSQAGLDVRMVALAQAGRRVARLHSGDAATFARASDTLNASADAGVTCDVIPGVTTASAVAARLGFSLTRREVAVGVLHVTAHEGIGWLDADILQHATVVIYMGLKRIDGIFARWAAAGLDDVPAVAVMRACLDEERVVFGYVQCLAERLKESEFESPTLVVVGQVVRDAQGWPFPKEGAVSAGNGVVK